jgi:hypothetical protein
MLATVFQVRLQIQQSLACIDDLDQPLACRVVGLARCFGEGLGEPGDHLRIDRIVLGEASGRAGEAAHPLRVDDPDFDAGLAQRLGPVLLITAGSLHGRLADPVFAKPADQRALPLRGTGERLPLRQRANARIHLVLGHINTDDNDLTLCHHPLPSLLGSGSKPVQLFGLRKTPDLSLAPRQALKAFERDRAQIQRRAVGQNRPFACSGTFSGHKSTK